jgi:hypothetical protein
MESDSGEFEFYLSEGSGDEYFEVLNEEGETVRDGDTVQIGRGDRVRLSFNAHNSEVGCCSRVDSKTGNWKGRATKPRAGPNQGID